MEISRNFFESKIKPILTYIGTIGAVLTSLAYMALVCILIFGFQAHNILQTLIFAVINGVIGLIIMQMLKVQGIDFAKQLPDNKPILAEYYSSKTKDKKLRSIKYFWITTVAKDVVFKAVSIAISTAGLIYIIVEGSEDYVLLLLALVNILMFFCFGLLSLSSAYDFFNNSHMAYVKEQLRLLKEEADVRKLSEEVLEESKTETTEEAQRVLPEEILEIHEAEVLEQTNDTSVLVG